MNSNSYFEPKNGFKLRHLWLVLQIQIIIKFYAAKSIISTFVKDTNFHTQHKYIFIDFAVLNLILKYTLFQVPELGDTLFIVLRKQQLIFLHW